MKKILILTSVLLAALVVQIAAQSQPKNFRGYVADKRVSMKLKRDGGKLYGSYFYQRIGKDLALDGTIDAQGKFVLTERDAKGAKTGEFSGVWKTEEDGSASLEGDWLNPKTKDKWTFYATEEIIEFTGGARFVNKVSAETNKPKMFEIKTEYPELSGVDAATAANFNRLVKNLVTRETGEFRKNMMAQTAEDIKFAKERGVNNYLEINYIVEFADDRLISISFMNSTYEGGAHPNSHSQTINFDLQTGREIKLSDLFKPNSNYLKAISDYSIKALKKKTGEMSDDEWIATGAGAKAENFDSWNIKRTGILINFDPYQVAAYAAGPQDVFIPFEILKNILKPEWVSRTKE